MLDQYILNEIMDSLALALKCRFVFVHNSKYLFCFSVLLHFSLYNFILYFMKRCCFGQKMKLEFSLVCWLPIERLETRLQKDRMGNVCFVRIHAFCHRERSMNLI